MTYLDFLKSKVEVAPGSGFQVEREKINPILKPHQRDAVAWACAGGRRALFESFGLGKSAQELNPLINAGALVISSYLVQMYTFEELLEGTEDQKKLLESIDILIDGPFLQAQKSLEIAFRGSRNQRILDVNKSLAAGKAVETTSRRWHGEY